MIGLLISFFLGVLFGFGVAGFLSTSTSKSVKANEAAQKIFQDYLLDKNLSEKE